MIPDYLCIGHCCHDRVGDDIVLGGTASYAATIATRLDWSAAILTSLGNDFRFLDYFRSLGIPLRFVRASQTTTFENLYRDQQRQQYLHARAQMLSANDIPTTWRQPKIIHFCPIADELEADLLQAFPDSLKGASIQGFLRQWDANGQVQFKAMDWTLLQALDIVIFSDEDIQGNTQFLEAIIKNCPIVVLTQGSNGATVFQQGQSWHFPAFPVDAIDPTGAGDAFTTAFLLNYYQTQDIRAACIFAHCTASFIIQGEGISHLPGPKEIELRELAYRERFG